MKRVLALLVAAGMIGGAVYLRGRMDDDGDPSGPDDPPASELVLGCVTELRAVCEAVASADERVSVKVEPAGTTVDALVARASGLDGWVTLDPWPAIADLTAGGRSVAGEVEPLLAQARLGFTIWNDRAQALAAPTGGCPGALTWKCLGDVSGTRWEVVGGDPTWGLVKVALPPRTSALGLLLLGHAASGYFGRADFASNDFATDPSFRPWLSKLERYGGPSDPLAMLLQQGPAAFAAVGVDEGHAGTTIAGSRAADELDVIYPDPPAMASVVFARVPGGEGGDVLSSLLQSAGRPALEELGWQLADTEAPTGLPTAGVLVALRNE